MARHNVTHEPASAIAELPLPEPGRRLLDLVRGRFVIAGSSLNRWCLENGVSRHAALGCLTGGYRRREAQKLRARILRAAGLTEGE